MVFGRLVGQISPQKATFWPNHVFLNKERYKVKTKRSEKNMGTMILNFDVSKPGEQRKQEKNKKWGSKREFFFNFQSQY